MVAIGLGGMPAQLLYRTVSASYDRQITDFKKQPMVSRETQYFQEKIATVNNVDELLKDYRLRSYLMKAFGLEDIVNSRALIKRVLTDDLSSDKALVYHMTDPRFVQMATALRLDEDFGNLKKPATIAAIVTKYQTNGFEEKVGEQSEAVRNVLYFKRNANAVTSMYQVLGDKVMREVAVKAAGLPDQFAALPIEKQAATLAKKLDVSKLSDPKYLDKLVQQYLVKADMQSSSQASLIAALFQTNGPTGFSFTV